MSNYMSNVRNFANIIKETPNCLFYCIGEIGSRPNDEIGCYVLMKDPCQGFTEERLNLFSGVEDSWHISITDVVESDGFAKLRMICTKDGIAKIDDMLPKFEKTFEVVGN